MLLPRNKNKSYILNPILKMEKNREQAVLIINSWAEVLFKIKS